MSAQRSLSTGLGERLDASSIVDEAVLSRRSIRGFLPCAVPTQTLEHILRVASRAPSGSNIQPWRVYVLQGATLGSVKNALTKLHLSGAPTSPGYSYYAMDWRAPYVDRRRKAGWGLYQLAGVAKGDRDAAHLQRARNYQFFGAPVGMVFTIDKTLGMGAWLDVGMFLQNIMIIARGHGLDTCPQAAIANYPDVLREHLTLSDNDLVICGMAIGYADPDEPTNALVTEREMLASFVTFRN